MIQCTYGKLVVEISAKITLYCIATLYVAMSIFFPVALIAVPLLILFISIALAYGTTICNAAVLLLLYAGKYIILNGKKATSSKNQEVLNHAD
jgi:hypothetical protein